MSKPILLEAECSGGIVQVDGLPLKDCVILSDGTGESSGFVIMFGAESYYIANASSDLETTLEKVIDAITSVSDALTQIGTTLTSLGAGMTGPTTAPPPTLPVDVAQINAKVTELAAAKQELTELKGALK